MTLDADPVRSLKQRRLPLASASKQRQLLGVVPLKREFASVWQDAGLAPLRTQGIGVLQVNVGKLCNQACRHCHVDAGPDRRESMARETFEACLAALRRYRIPTVDITGGAPELNPNFRWFVQEARALGCHVIDRCNLTILHSRGYQDLPEFFAEHQVEVVCSLPAIAQACTDKQRGLGTYQKSISALKRLNQVGYGKGALRLVLVSNPIGASLPGAQASLEQEWKQRLRAEHGIEFDALYTITNMPISRFLESLEASSRVQEYLELLVAAFNPAAAQGVMCKHTLSVGYDGTLYDCDFNQMLEMPVTEAAPRTIFDFDRRLFERQVQVGRHCFGCTAGSGSGCSGATV